MAAKSDASSAGVDEPKKRKPKRNKIIHARWSVYSPFKRTGSKFYKVKVRDTRNGRVHWVSTEEAKKASNAEQAALDWITEKEARETQIPLGTAGFAETFREYLSEKTCRPVTLESAWIDFQGFAPGKKKPKRERKARGVYLPEFGEKLLAEITRSDIKAFVRKLTRDGASVRTRRKHLGALKTFFNWCIDDHDPPYLSVNPAAKEKAGDGEEKEARTLIEDEARRLLAAARKKTILPIRDNRRRKGEQSWPAPAHLYVALAIAFYTGLRRRTIHELTWHHVDLAGGAIEVPGLLMKRGKAHRVPIHPALDRVLRAAARGQMEKKRERKVKPDARVIGKEIGKTLTALHSACRRAGIEPAIGWHTCRHSAATWLARFAPFGVVKAFLAHKPKDVTLGYVHASWPDLVREVGKLPDLIGEGASPVAAPGSAL